MPFDVRDFPEAPPEVRAADWRNRRLVAGWLFAICGMILIMFALGAATRLSGSGLSIMEWAPMHGVLPPLTEREWERLFALYRDIPQYALLNAGMDMDGFRRIFWLEWIHRLWGRLIGVAILLPLAWFWLRGRIERRMARKLVAILVLLGLQGAVGWFMVASGFAPEATKVSPYRLVAHLGLAFLLFGMVFWTALTVLRPVGRLTAVPVALTRLAWLSVGLAVFTMLAGGFVAGLGAGRDYNTFPLMDGELVPAGYARLTPFWLNLTENVAAVQFHHRLLATATLLAALASWAVAARRGLPQPVCRLFAAFAGLVAAQYAVGIATLLSVVAMDLAILHQVTAVLVLGMALLALHALRPPPSART